MYFESPQLAYWDAEKHNWKLDAFTDSQYDEGTSWHQELRTDGSIVEHRAVMREVVSSTPAGPALRDLK